MNRGRIDGAYAGDVILAVFLVLVVVFVVLPIVGVALWWLISTAIVGLIMGGLGRLIVPGHNPIGFLATVCCGLVGALVGGAIGHAIGGRFGVPHGEALALVLPQVLRFNAAVCRERIADLAFPLGAGRTGRSAAWNADAAIDAVAALTASLGLGELPAGTALTPADYPQIAEDALADEVLANTPRQPAAADITSLLADACQPRR